MTLKGLAPEFAAVLKKSAAREKFSGKTGQLLELTAPADCRADRLLLIGLGEERAPPAKLSGGRSVRRCNGCRKFMSTIW